MHLDHRDPYQAALRLLVCLQFSIVYEMPPVRLAQKVVRAVFSSRNSTATANGSLIDTRRDYIINGVTLREIWLNYHRQRDLAKSILATNATFKREAGANKSVSVDS